MVSIFYYRNNQISTWKCSCHSDIDEVLFNDAWSIHGYILPSEIFYRLTNSFYENRVKGNFSRSLFECRLNLVAPFHNVGNISFNIRSYMWRSLFWHHHMVRNQFTHAIHFNDFKTTTYWYSRSNRSGWCSCRADAGLTTGAAMDVPPCPRCSRWWRISDFVTRLFIPDRQLFPIRTWTILPVSQCCEQSGE